MDKITLGKGANLYINKSDKFKSWSVSIYIYRPLTPEEATYNALLAKVIKTATKKYPSRRSLNLKLDSMYGAVLSAGVRKYADTHALIVTLKGVSDKYLPEKISEDILSFAREVIEEPFTTGNSFDEKTFELEKDNLKKQIESYVNDKTFYADIRGLEVLCGEDNYAVDASGSIDVLNTITNEKLFNHYKKIISKSKVDIFLCGDCDPDIAERSFDSFKSEGILNKATPFVPGDDITTVFEEMEVTQGKLIMGFCFPYTDNKYRCSAMVFNAVFGGSATSKLFNNVREKLSLAYYANTRMSFSKGIIFARSGIEIAKYEETKNEILNQLDEICKGNITDEELQNAKAHIINLYSALEDDPESKVSLISGWITEGENRSIEEIIDGIEAVTKEEIVSIAKETVLKAIYFLKNKEANK